MSSEVGADIAIVGMAGIFPGSATLSDYWQNIVGKVDCVGDPPPDWQPELFLDEAGGRADRAYVGRGGYLGDLCRFDPVRYGVMPNSIDGAEPDQFLALRCAFEAVADAGVPELPLHRERTGVILGRGTYVNRGYVSLLQRGFVIDQVLELLRQLEPDRSEGDLERIGAALRGRLPPSDAATAPGLAHSVMVGRIANRMDLKGPAYTVDAACASSLLALEHGVSELRSGRCDAVLVGGVQVSTLGFIHLVFCQIEALSRAGQIAPFSDEASGTLLGSGCGVMLIKRRADAERDGHRIYALVKAVGVSSDGRGAGLLAPNREGQQLAMQRAYERSTISPASVALVEAHGSGIPLGDATEFASLRRVFADVAPGDHVAVGSVKSMISHLIPAAGVASLMKTALAIYHRVLPATLHAETPSPALRIEESPFYLNGETRPWIHAEGVAPRRAGVNAFGFGGINAHAILEEHGAADSGERLERRWPVELVLVSAPDRHALASRAVELASWVERARGVTLLDVAAACARDRSELRLAICARDLADLQRKLCSAAAKLESGAERIQDRGGVFFYDAPLAREGRTASIFPGEGSQYVNMLADLCRHFPAVRAEFDALDDAVGEPLSRWIYPPPGSEVLAQQALYGMQCAIETVAAASRGLLALLRDLGVSTDAFVGHSSGEFTALVASGAVPLTGRPELRAAIRAGADTTHRVLEAEWPRVALLAVGADSGGVVRELLADEGDALRLALDNCPNQQVLAGAPDCVARAAERLRARGCVCQVLPWDRPYHTDWYAAALPAMREFYERLAVGAPQGELWSCASADRYPEDAEGIRDLVVRQWASPVRFRETIERMYQAGVRIFVEVGPRGALTSFVSDTLQGRPHLAVALDTPRRGGVEQLCRALAMLAAHGVRVDLAQLYARRGPASLDFATEPPPAPVPAPPLRLDLPTLELDPALLRSLARSPGPGPAPETGRAGARVFAADSAQSGTDSAVRAPASAPASLAKERAFGELQHTLREFLATQERLAQAWFSRSGASGPGPAASPSAPARTTPSVRTLGRSDSRASAAGADEATPHAGRETSDPCAPGASTGGPDAPGLDRESAPRSLESLREGVLRIVGERTGYPRELLGEDVDLEGDLGIDSIKRAEIAGALRRALLPDAPGASGAFSERMSRARSLRQITALLAELGGAGAAPSVERESPSPAVPLPPLIQRVLELEPGVRAVAQARLDPDRLRFLRDHTLGRQVSQRVPELRGLPVMPLAGSMELLAETASLLQPGRRPSALSGIECRGWFAFPSGARQVRCEAVQSGEGGVEASLYDAEPSGDAVALVRARVEFRSLPADWRTARVRGEVERASSWSREALYSRGLFHGPSLQTVLAMDGWGRGGARARLRARGAVPLVDAPEVDRLALPLELIDGAGQVVGFWGSEPGGKMGFPSSVRRLELGDACAALEADELLAARVDADASSPGEWRSDVELLDSDGGVVLRMQGRVDRVAPIPDAYWQLRAEPERVVLSQRATELFRAVPGSGHWTLALLEGAHEALAEPSGFWALALSRVVLSAGERRQFDASRSTPAERAAWLLARIAAKDAVRLHLASKECAADIELESDAQGDPRMWELPGSVPLRIRVSHAPGCAVALAADADAFSGVGIAVEPLRALDPALIETAFAPEERGLLEAVAGAQGELVRWQLSVWSAKQAVEQALGAGLPEGSRSIEITGIDTSAGRIRAELHGSPARAAGPGGRGGALDVYCAERMSRVLAVCLVPRENGGERVPSDVAGAPRTQGMEKP